MCNMSSYHNFNPWTYEQFIEFIGVNYHWIDKNLFERKSVSLAFERFSGSHTFDRIAEKLHNILENLN